MWYLMLDNSQTESSLHDFRISLKDEKFLATGRPFLSALAAISKEELEQLRPNLLPHEVRADLCVAGPSSSYGLPFPSSNTANGQELFSTYTTLEDNFSRSSSTDTQHSTEDEEGNITVFSTRSYLYNPNCDQVMTSNGDLDRSPNRRLAHHETSENGEIDVATLNSLSVTQLLESDSDSLSTDSQVTARPRFRNDSTDLNAARGLSQSYEIESSPLQLHSTTKRARRTPNTTRDQPNSIAVNAQSTNKSPMQTENPEPMGHAKHRFTLCQIT